MLKNVVLSSGFNVFLGQLGLYFCQSPFKVIHKKKTTDTAASVEINKLGKDYEDDNQDQEKEVN